MGKRGPKRQPTNILKLRKSRLAKGRADIEIDPNTPKCPVTLKGRNARRYWREIVPDLEKMGILAIVDAESLADLCRVYEEKIKLEPNAIYPVIRHEKKDKEGNIKVTFSDNKLYYAYWGAVDRFEKMKKNFFMSPADRAGMGNVQKKKKMDEKTRFFEKRE